MHREFSVSKIFRLSTPAIVFQAGLAFIAMIELLLVSRIGVTAIALFALSEAFISLLDQFMEGIRVGTMVLTARFLGAKDDSNIARTLNVSLFFTFLFCSFLIFFSSYISKFIFSVFADRELNNQFSYDFINIRIFAFSFMLIFSVLINFFKGLMITFYPTILIFVISIFTVLLDCLFVFILNQIGLSYWSVFGMGWANFISYIIATVLCFILLFKFKASAKYINFFLNFKKIFKEFLKIVIEIGLSSGVFSLAYFILPFIIGQLGIKALAIHQIAIQVFTLLYILPNGFLSSSSILMGKIIGEKRKDLMIYGILKNMIVTFSLSSVFSGIIFFSSFYIANFYGSNDSFIISNSILAIKIICLEQLFAPIYITLKGTFLALEDTRFVALADCFTTYFLFIPAVYLLSIKLGYGVLGEMVAIVIWTFSGCVFYLIRLLVMIKYNYKNKFNF